ncbi:MAG: hypothetical protein M1837_005616 [Sclerophora amabilis]|nr:MAG: hypothetical protein M1837_005616 [Sclerophora amabilis]
MPQAPARLRNLNQQDPENPAFEGNPAQRRAARNKRRQRKIDRRRQVLREEVRPTPSEVRDVLHRRICSEGIALNMNVNDALSIAREILQWRHINGVLPTSIIPDHVIHDFIAAVFDQNWRLDLKLPPALVEREEPKREEGRDLAPEPAPKQRQKGQPVFLQFQRNKIVPSFLLQDAASRAVSFRWVELNPGLDLQDEMVRITIEVDNAEQAYISRYNRILLVHSARWRLWQQYGDPNQIASVNERKRLAAPNRPCCIQPFFKGTQAITFGEKMQQAITNRRLDRLPENIYGQSVTNNPGAYYPAEDNDDSTYSGVTDMED